VCVCVSLVALPGDCASGEAADMGPLPGSGPASSVPRPFHPSFLRPVLATAPVITRGLDAAASPALTLPGKSLEPRKAPAGLLQEALLATLTINIFRAPTRCWGRVTPLLVWVGLALHTAIPCAPAPGDVPKPHVDPRRGRPLPPRPKSIGR
jgi:hypothetical protein